MADFYTVTGTLTPDATGDYFVAGTHDGKPYYRREDGMWFLVWQGGASWWMIRDGIDGWNDPIWYRNSSIIIGQYHPEDEGASIGYATVVEGELQNAKRPLVNGSLVGNNLVGKGLVR